MKMKERNIFIRVIILLAGFLVVSIIVESIKLALKQYGGISIGGAIPTLIMYGLPYIILMSWLGFFKSKKSNKSEQESKPTPKKWTE